MTDKAHTSEQAKREAENEAKLGMVQLAEDAERVLKTPAGRRLMRVVFEGLNYGLLADQLDLRNAETGEVDVTGTAMNAAVTSAGIELADMLWSAVPDRMEELFREWARDRHRGVIDAQREAVAEAKKAEEEILE